MRAVIPPSGVHCHAGLPRFTMDLIPEPLDLFESRLGVFRTVATFPHCREPHELDDPLAVYRVPTLFLFSMAWTLQLMLQCSKGVALCHRVDIVHRDLEPWNIMFDRFGRPKVIDFGYAEQLVRLLRCVGRLHAYGAAGAPAALVVYTEGLVRARACLHTRLEQPRTTQS